MNRDQLLASVAEIISDYREGEIARPDVAHVNRWISQFSASQQIPLLSEINYSLKQTYFSKERILRFLIRMLRSNNIAGDDPCDFWKSCNFLDIQLNGKSQHEMLLLLDRCIQEQCGIKLARCGSPTGHYIYLDDVIFSGSRAGHDLEAWILNQAPANITLHIVAVALHRLAEWQLGNRLNDVAKSVAKEIRIHFWGTRIENRKKYKESSEVLWPVASLPQDQLLNAYLSRQSGSATAFIPRTPGGKTKHNFFSSEPGRQLLESEMLLAGVKIRSFPRSSKEIMKPLGFNAYGLGFGSLIATFRNCPNNCPLALWWGDHTKSPSHPFSKWYPLLPRKTYEDDGIF